MLNEQQVDDMANQAALTLRTVADELPTKFEIVYTAMVILLDNFHNGEEAAKTAAILAIGADTDLFVERAIDYRKAQARINSIIEELNGLAMHLDKSADRQADRLLMVQWLKDNSDKQTLSVVLKSLLADPLPSKLTISLPE